MDKVNKSIVDKDPHGKIIGIKKDSVDGIL